MSLFDPTTGEPTSTAEASGNQSSFVQQLVAAKGDIWSDPEVIAKGKLEADRFVQEQATKIKELEAKIIEQDYAKQLFEKLQAQTAPASTPQEPVVQTGAQPTEETTLDVEKVQELVTKALQEAQVKQNTQQNLSTVESKMSEMFGDKASEKVKTKADELGVSVSFLQNIASESPNAFLHMFSEPSSPSTPHTKSTVNTAGMGNTGERNWNYYENLRKTDPTLYWSKATQDQIVKDYQALGSRWKT